LRVNGSNANNEMCSEVRAPSSTSPPSPRRVSNPLTCPPRTPTEGTSTEDDFVQIQREYRTPLSTNTTSTEAIKHHKPPLPKRDRPVAKQPQSTSPRGIQIQLHLTQEGVNYNLNLYQRGSKPQPKLTSTKEGYTK